MESIAENEEFFFVWKIENFSMCPQKSGSALQSPSFTMGILDKTKWHLKIYPTGDPSSILKCWLTREEDQYPSPISLSSQFSLLICGGISKLEFNVENYTYSNNGHFEHKLLKFSSLFEKKCLFLPRDTLTLHCRLWKSDNSVSTVPATLAVKALVECLYDYKPNTQTFPEDLYSSAAKDIDYMKKRLYPYNNECSARTRIGIEKRSFEWPIKNFSKIKNDEKLSIPLGSVSKRVPLFVLLAKMSSSGDFNISVKKVADDDGVNIFVRCRIIVLDIEGREHSSSENQHHFEKPKSNEEWSYPPFLKKDQLIENKLLCLSNDILTLRFEFIVSIGIEFSAIENYNYISLACETNTSGHVMGSMAEDITTFYADRKHFDVKLKVEGEHFSAHKAMLAARSPVFSAMFEHETAEKAKNSVDIPDVEKNTLRAMLSFIYSDKVEKLDVDNAIKLYAAADKYQIVSLKKLCSQFLNANIKRKNVFEILVLADMIHDQELKISAHSFLFKPPFDEIFSTEFDAFLVNNTELAGETLRQWLNTLKTSTALNV